MCSKRLISLLLAVVLVVSLFPHNIVSAADVQTTVITVEDSYAAAGATVSVDITIKNNPGILAMTLKLNFDESIATLTGVENGEAMSDMSFAPPVGDALKSGCQLGWDAETVNADSVKDGVIATLTFKIDDDAAPNQVMTINVSSIGDIIDDATNPVPVETVAGKMDVLDYVPGDVNGDGLVTSTDTAYLRRYIAGGYGVTINEAAGDVNADGLLTSVDVAYIRRFIAGGYGITLKPSTPKCAHDMQSTAAKAATCTKDGNNAYWYCTKCEKYFNDEAGTVEVKLADTIVPAKHNLIHVEARAATTEENGNIEHWKCNNCGKYFGNSNGTIELEESEVVVSKVVKEESTVVYNVYGSDTYLKSVGVENPNADKFYAADGLVLNDLVAPEGYVFKGWTTASGTPITEIEPGNPRQITLNAVWEKREYTISFYSPIAPRASIKRTIDEAVPVDDLNELTKYKFMGWTDIYGNQVTIVQPGTKDITLYANWISYRNQTISHDYLNKGPITIEDEEKGQYLFIYDIGKIINVPLYTIKDFGNTTSGIIRVESETVTNSISNTTAKEITETIANSTTNSATWTLSQDWNELITNTEDFTETQLKENSIVISDGWAHTEGNATNTGTVTDTGTLTKDNTNTKDLTTHNAGGSVEVDIEIAKKGLASKLSPVGVDIKAEGHYDYTHQGGKETDQGKDEYNLTHTNDLTSKSSSTTNSHDKTTSEKIAEEVSKQWGYSISKSTGGGSSASENSSNTQSNESMYSTTFSYTVAQEKTTVKEYSTASAEPGWHRLVCAGTVHVFAVVGYDIATHTYFYYTYSVLDDTTSEFYDYSATNGEYNDYEVGVLPFEVPVSIHEYVTDKIYLTNGLIIDDKTGVVVEYEGDYTHVNIPDYYSRDNGDGTYDIVKIVGIESSVFANNTNIKSVRLSNFITEIPNNAFYGCTNLEVVDYNKLVSIGANAFRGCTSLKKFTIETDVTSLGADAFVNVPEVTLNACNYNVASNGARCGAKYIILNLRTDAQDLENCTISTETTSESFTVNGYKNVYKNFEIVSNCAMVNINGITFDSNIGTPMTFSTNKVILTNVNVTNVLGLALLLKADSTNLVVDGSNTLHTLGDAAILCKEIDINKQSGSSVKCALQVPNGKIYICGSELTEIDRKYLEASETQIEYIDVQQYTNMLNSHYVHFDANGGTVEAASKLIMWNSQVGELPVPTRTDCTFLGWYKADGTQLTADAVFTELDDITVKAYWETGWVKASSLPSGASATETKWTYDLITQTTSSSATAPEGFSAYKDPTWVWGEYGSWSSWSKTEATASDSREVETQNIAAKTKTQYNYHRYLDSNYYWTSHSKGTFSGYYCHIYQETGWLDYALTWKETVDGSHNRYGTYNGSDYWYDPQTRTVTVTPAYTEYRYRDRSKIYTYYYQKIEAKESVTEINASSTVSNVQEWVKYVIN